jgi:CBS domain-containing protein
MKKLREILREGFLFVLQKDGTVSEAARLMARENVGIVAVLDGVKLVGVCSERDIVRRVIDRGLDPKRTPVTDAMTTNVVVADENEDYQSAIRKMDQANIRHLPVVRGDMIVSMLSIRDLMRVDMQRMDEEIKFLQAYLYQVPPEIAERDRQS